MAARIFLALSALVWLPYGLYCFVQPSFLAEAAGVLATSPTATTEIRAMYGGLQAAIGALCLTALFRASFVRPALVMLAFLCSALFVTRLAGLLLDGGLSAYTAGGLLFEFASAGAADTLLTRRSASDLAGTSSSSG